MVSQSHNSLLGSADIPSQLDNWEGCRDTWSFVGVGAPTLCLHIKDNFGLLSVDFPKLTLWCRDMNLDLQSTVP